MEKQKEKQNFKGFQNKYYNLNNNFEFDKDNWKVNGMIFAASALFFPFLFTLICFLVFNLSTNQTTQLTVNLVQMVSIAVGFSVLYARNKSYIVSGKGWLFFYTIIPTCIVLVLGQVVISLFGGGDTAIALGGMLLNIIGTGVVLLLILLIDKKLVVYIKESFQKHWKSLVVTGIIGAIILIAAQYGTGAMESLWTSSTSKNQDNIIGILKKDSGASVGEKTIYGILIGIYTMLLAPLVEELVFRYCWNLNTANKWFGFITSALYFGYLHYGVTGDFEHALSYTCAGFVLGGVFLFTKGNVVASWMAHFLNNAFAFIVIIATALA